jgi:hypothetical protein
VSTTEKLRRNLTLPESVGLTFDMMVGSGGSNLRNAYMRVLRDRGWTLQSIAEAVGDISRERARQCVESVSSEDAEEALYGMSIPIPDLPDKPERPKPTPRPLPSDVTLTRLRELQPLAAQVRYAHGQYRDEAEEYVALLWYAHTVEGVSVYRLGKLLGTLPCGIESRFVRYGYKETNGTSASFTPVKYRKTATK